MHSGKRLRRNHLKSGNALTCARGIGLCMPTAFISGTEGYVSSIMKMVFDAPYFLCGTRCTGIDLEIKHSG